jgi:hypothetical protein
MGFTVERTNYATLAALATAVINDLAGNGFTVKYVNAGGTTPGTMTATKATFEASASVDPLQGTQPWRVQVDASGASLFVRGGTVTQLTDAGVTTGSIPWTGPAGTDVTTNQHSYRLSISSKGFVLHVYNQVSPTAHGLVCIQRLVDRSTGNTITDGKSPVLMAYAPYNNAVVSMSWLRESDITAPTTAVSTSVVGTNQVQTLYLYSYGANQCPTVDDEGSYWVSFLNNLATSRALYRRAEVDMFGVVPEAGYADGANVNITVYGESSARVYRAMPRSGIGAVRFVILTSGGGV